MYIYILYVYFSYIWFFFLYKKYLRIWSWTKSVSISRLQSSSFWIFSKVLMMLMCWTLCVFLCNSVSCIVAWNQESSWVVQAKMELWSQIVKPAFGRCPWFLRSCRRIGLYRSPTPQQLFHKGIKQILGIRGLSMYESGFFIVGMVCIYIYFIFLPIFYVVVFLCILCII